MAQWRKGEGKWLNGAMLWDVKARSREGVKSKGCPFSGDYGIIVQEEFWTSSR